MNEFREYTRVSELEEEDIFIYDGETYSALGYIDARLPLDGAQCCVLVNAVSLNGEEVFIDESIFVEVVG